MESPRHAWEKKEVGPPIQVSNFVRGPRAEIVNVGQRPVPRLDGTGADKKECEFRPGRGEFTKNSQSLFLDISTNEENMPRLSGEFDGSYPFGN